MVFARDEPSAHHEGFNLDWLSRMRPRSAVRVDRAAVACEGWVWKKSKHLSVWRSRWMVLAVDGQLLTFEDDGQHSGATARFIVSDVPSSIDLGNLAEPFTIEVKYPSKRRAAMLMAGLKGVEELRTATLVIDAGPAGNKEWRKRLRETFLRPSMQKQTSFGSFASDR